MKTKKGDDKMEHFKDLWLVIGLTVLLAVTVTISTASITGNGVFGRTTRSTVPAKVLTTTNVDYLSLNGNTELLKTQIFNSKQKKPATTASGAEAPVCIFMDIANNPSVIGKSGNEACAMFLNGKGNYACTASVFNMIYAYYSSTDGTCTDYKSTDSLTQVVGANAGPNRDDPCSYILSNNAKTVTPSCWKTSGASQPSSLDMSASELDRGVWCCKTE